jgi:hypothetical protein
MQLVELQDARPGCLPPGKSYADLYRDVRGAVDLCHRDGSIKREVARRPGHYIYDDPGLVPLLDVLRQSGKKGESTPGCRQRNTRAAHRLSARSRTAPRACSSSHASLL